MNIYEEIKCHYMPKIMVGPGCGINGTRFIGTLVFHNGNNLNVSANDSGTITHIIINNNVINKRSI